MAVTAGATGLAQTLVTELRAQLAESTWPSGAKLSTRELGRRYGVHRATVQRALHRLEEQGLVECRPRSGWYVRQRPLDTSAAVAPRVARAESLAGMHVAVSLGMASNTLLTESTWTGTILASLRRRLAEFGIDLLLWSHDPTQSVDPALSAERLRHDSPQLLGVAALNPLELEPIENLLDQHQIPWVTVNRKRAGVLYNFVSADNGRAGRMVGRVFALMRRQRVWAVMGDIDEFPSEREKFEGLCSGYAVSAGHLPTDVQLLACHGSSQEDGFRSVQAHLKTHEPPQAVFCGGDNIALGAIRALQQHGLRVPKDVSVVGNAGFDLGQWSTPSLATFSQPMTQIGAAVADMLIEMAQQGLRRVPGRILRGELILRQSLALTPAMRQQLQQEMAEDQPDDSTLLATSSSFS